MCFLRGLLESVMEAKNINDSCIFDLQWYVVATRGNSSEEIVGSWQNNSFCQRNMYCYFPACNLIGQLCLKLGPDYSSNTVRLCG